METKEVKKIKKEILSYELINCPKLSDYREYVNFLIELNFDTIFESFLEKRKEIFAEFQERGYENIILSFSIHECNATYHLFLTGKETDTKINEITKEIFAFSYLRLYGYSSSTPRRLQRNDWNYENQKKINQIFKSIDKRISDRETKEKAKVELEDRQKREKKEKEIFKRNNWIKKNGSAHLQTMLVRGYELKKTYEIERGKKELPEFKYVPDTNYHYTDRANPSENAIDAETEYLKTFANVSIYWEQNLEIELIVIEPDWSRYDFAKEI